MESMDTSNAVFSIGADKKMTMSLDDIIKTNSKGKKQRKVGKSAVMNNQDSKKKRQKQLVSSVTKRASSLRQNRVDKMRGISTSNNNNNNTNNKPMRVTRTSGRFLVKKRVTESPRAVRAKRLSTGAANTRVRGAVTTWSAQQRQRRQNASKKIAKAKQTSVATNYTFSTGTNQDKRQTRGLLNKRTSRSESNANNTRNNTRQAANERRGIAQKGSNIKITTLNERFTNARPIRSNNNTGRLSTRGRGQTRGAPRGGNIRSNKSGPASVRPTSTSSRGSGSGSGRGRGGNNNTTRGNSNRGGRGRGRARN